MHMMTNIDIMIIYTQWHLIALALSCTTSQFSLEHTEDKQTYPHAPLHICIRIYVQGFTSSTGSSWEKHDILSWYFCEAEGCPLLTGNATELELE